MYNNIFDSHCHYSDECFDIDREYMLSEYLPKQGVIGLIHAGASLETSRFGVEYSGKYPYMYCSVGVHPEDADIVPPDCINQLKGMARASKKVVAIGEIGLDYHYEGYSRESQIKLFKEQLQLAEDLKLPVIIHSRDASEDTMSILREYRPKGVMHCFSGSAETAKEVQALGMYISFTGVVTFKNARKAIEAAAAVSNDRIMLETDCPYMSPEPNRGKRCDSSMIRYTAEKIAEIKGLNAQEVIDICTENTKRLFGI